jgi:predicted ATPase
MLGTSREPTLRGRDDEAGQLRAVVDRAMAGRLSVAVIEGEAGIGKTRLVQTVVEDARGRGVNVDSGQAHPFERTRPFGVVAAALGLKRRAADSRRTAIGELLAGPDSQYRVVQEIVDLVDTLCADGPVLLVLEDLHWVDSASLLAILSLVRQLPLAPLLVATTLRPAPLRPDVARLVDDRAAGTGRWLRLRPLTPDEIAALASNMLGGSPRPVDDRDAGQGRRKPRCGPSRCCARWPTTACCVVTAPSSSRPPSSCRPRSATS